MPADQPKGAAPTLPSVKVFKATLRGIALAQRAKEQLIKEEWCENAYRRAIEEIDASHHLILIHDACREDAERENATLRDRNERLEADRVSEVTACQNLTDKVLAEKNRAMHFHRESECPKCRKVVTQATDNDYGAGKYGIYETDCPCEVEQENATLRARIAELENRWVNYRNWVRSKRPDPARDHVSVCMALGFAGESGELIDSVKKLVCHEVDVPREKFVEEAGDAFFYFTALLDDLGLTLDEVMLANREKLNERYPDGFVKGGGIRG